MPRKNPLTSIEAYEKICREGARETVYLKIINALKVIGDGTSWEISAQAGIKPDKVWKRQSELVSLGIIFDTGLRRNSPDGNKAMVYSLFQNKEKYSHVKPPERFNNEEIKAADNASALIAGTKKQQLIQI